MLAVTSRLSGVKADSVASTLPGRSSGAMTVGDGDDLTIVPRWASVPTSRRACNCGDETCHCEAEELSRSATSDDAPAVAPPSVFDVLRTSGDPLDASTRSWFEPRLGMD